MKWRKAPQELVSLLDEAARSVEGSEKRMMFGFPAYFINGNMFLAAHQESLILRLDSTDREALLSSHEGFAQFEPMPGRRMKEYLIVPESIYRDGIRFSALLSKSSAYAHGLPVKTSGSKRQLHSKE
jgi:TfoX/Sxy family transcriptional regulator of competence genes